MPDKYTARNTAYSDKNRGKTWNDLTLTWDDYTMTWDQLDYITFWNDKYSPPR
jgi:hypothetical protein